MMGSMYLYIANNDKSIVSEPVIAQSDLPKYDEIKKEENSSVVEIKDEIKVASQNKVIVEKLKANKEILKQETQNIPIVAQETDNLEQKMEKLPTAVVRIIGSSSLNDSTMTSKVF